MKEKLLSRGLAFVYPVAGDESHVDHMLAAEHRARLRGVLIGQQILRHRLTRLKIIWFSGICDENSGQGQTLHNKVYLNFGANWQANFTITIDVTDPH